jgi:excisionase family DNA binding protein
MNDSFTPRQVARALGVSESSLKRWCDRDILKTVRTAGGHRRVAFDEVARFCRESGRTLAEPELLGLPAAVGSGTTVFGRAALQFKTALIAGDEEVARRVVLDLFLTKHSIRQIGDEVIAPALREIGSEWQCGEVAVWQERRGCEIVQRVIFELSRLAPNPTPTAPLALGATLEGDPYRLSTMLCEAALREAGWRAESLGSSIPIPSLIEALWKLKPKLCWVSVSHIAALDSYIAGLNDLYRATHDAGIALAIGGRAIDDALCERIRYSVRCGSLAELHAYAETLRDAGGATPAKKKRSP